MRESAFRPKDYSCFHTVCDSQRSVNQKVGHDSENWASQWANNNSGSGCTITRSMEESKRLRSENEALKKRLNAANNAIRDMEKIYKNERRRRGESKPRMHRFLGGKKRNGQEKGVYNSDDQSAFGADMSQASTVQMGSSKLNEKLHPTRKRDEDNYRRRHNSPNHSTSDRSSKPKFSFFGELCSRTLIVTPAKRRSQRLAKESKGKSFSTDDEEEFTPPCTPERTMSDEEVRPLPLKDILMDINETLGASKQHESAAAANNERQNKLLSFGLLMSKKPLPPVKVVEGEMEDGSYPIELQQANPIDDYEGDHFESEEDNCYGDDSSDLSIIYECTREDSSTVYDEDRVEI